jgi:hypothetical protein
LPVGPSADKHSVAGIDVSRPNLARVYDALLGGKDNFAADRELVARAMQLAPNAPLAAARARLGVAGRSRDHIGTSVLQCGPGGRIPRGSGLCG